MRLWLMSGVRIIWKGSLVLKHYMWNLIVDYGKLFHTRLFVYFTFLLYMIKSVLFQILSSKWILSGMIKLWYELLYVKGTWDSSSTSTFCSGCNSKLSLCSLSLDFVHEFSPGWPFFTGLFCNWLIFCLEKCSGQTLLKVVKNIYQKKGI